MDDKSGVWFRQAEGEYKWAEEALRLANLFIRKVQAELEDA